jgi:hypothetical protein
LPKRARDEIPVANIAAGKSSMGINRRLARADACRLLTITL